MTKNEAPALTDLAADALPGVEDDETPITRLTEDDVPVEFLNDLDQWDPEAEFLSDEEQAEREFYYRSGRY